MCQAKIVSEKALIISLLLSLTAWYLCLFDECLHCAEWGDWTWTLLQDIGLVREKLHRTDRTRHINWNWSQSVLWTRKTDVWEKKGGWEEQICAERGRATETGWRARQADSLPRSSLQHHKWLRNTWAHSACTIDYYRPVEQNLRINLPHTQWIRLQNKQCYNVLYVCILTLFRRSISHMISVSRANTGTRESVCVCVWCGV